ARTDRRRRPKGGRRSMYEAERALEDAAWAAAEGTATQEQLAQLEADPRGWRRVLERMIDDTEDQLDVVRQLTTVERDPAVAGVDEPRGGREPADARLTRAADPGAALPAADPAGEVRLQASWEAGVVVVWAAGPDVPPADNGQLADRLEAIGGPKLGWSLH